MPTNATLNQAVIAQILYIRQQPMIDAPLGYAGRPTQLQLLLLIVAYHPSSQEVEQLQACLMGLSPSVGYAVVVNDHHPGEPVEQLAAEAVMFIKNRDNLGYGCATNQLVKSLGTLPPYIGILNTDIYWQSGTFEQALLWLQQHPEVKLAVPQIKDEAGRTQQLCKRNPTVLGMISRRFIPKCLKPGWLKRYDDWYVMADMNYNDTFDVPYLSGCCMLICREAFYQVGGFDERYFLYLEDADITRKLGMTGRCVHLPLAIITHKWGRENYVKLRLTAINLASAWHYFQKWGWAFW